MMMPTHTSRVVIAILFISMSFLSNSTEVTPLPMFVSYLAWIEGGGAGRGMVLKGVG